MDLLDLTYALVGVGALLAGLLPRLLADRSLSMPIVFLGLGMAVFGLVDALPDPDPLRYPAVTERITEIALIVALMGAGLKLDRPIGRRSWSSTWRLLAIAMPLTIAGIALFGALAMGLSAAAAVLLGAALAPTDPVLAGDIGVGPPGDEEERDPNFSVTGEAGLNDGLAFPFVLLGLFVAAEDGTGWLGEWLLADVAWGIAGGVAIGGALGYGIAALAGRLRDRLGADGINLLNSSGAAAWQTVPHFHMHVIPRYAGDPLRLPWTPGPGDRDEIAEAARALEG